MAGAGLVAPAIFYFIFICRSSVYIFFRFRMGKDHSDKFYQYSFWLVGDLFEFLQAYVRDSPIFW